VGADHDAGAVGKTAPTARKRREDMLALEGIKVLDLSNYVPGALCTMILADFETEVIKVEQAKAIHMGDMS